LYHSVTISPSIYGFSPRSRNSFTHRLNRTQCLAVGE
jgi:hypothetical protein